MKKNSMTRLPFHSRGHIPNVEVCFAASWSDQGFRERSMRMLEHAFVLAGLKEGGILCHGMIKGRAVDLQQKEVVQFQLVPRRLGV